MKEHIVLGISTMMMTQTVNAANSTEQAHIFPTVVAKKG